MRAPCRYRLKTIRIQDTFTVPAVGDQVAAFGHTAIQATRVGGLEGWGAGEPVVPEEHGRGVCGVRRARRHNPLGQVLGFGPCAELLEHAQLRSEVQEALQESLDRYSNGG